MPVDGTFSASWLHNQQNDQQRTQRLSPLSFAFWSSEPSQWPSWVVGAARIIGPQTSALHLSADSGSVLHRGITTQNPIWKFETNSPWSTYRCAPTTPAGNVERDLSETKLGCDEEGAVLSTSKQLAEAPAIHANVRWVYTRGQGWRVGMLHHSGLAEFQVIWFLLNLVINVGWAGGVTKEFPMSCLDKNVILFPLTLTHVWSVDV
jgi:hypothetical protein